jgi:acyl-coenzyme A thioesterase PaaI-like protein
MIKSVEIALQDQHTPHNRCFGCGPASEHGLQLKSRLHDGVVVADWQPDRRYETTGGILSGGIISSLLECHASWGMAVALMARDRLDQAPTSLVTKEMTVKFRRPVHVEPDSPVSLTATVLEERGREWVGESELTWNGQVCASARLTSVDLNAPVPPATSIQGVGK